jgi:hypothetical protein
MGVTSHCRRRLFQRSTATERIESTRIIRNRHPVNQCKLKGILLPKRQRFLEIAEIE